MSEDTKIKVLFLMEHSMEPVLLEIENDEDGQVGLFEQISKTENVALLDMTPFNIPNTLMLLDNEMSTNPGSYNLSIQVYPVFGKIAFVEVGQVGDDVKIVDMSEETIELITRFVKERKEYEIEAGIVNQVNIRVSKMGKANYLKEIDMSLSMGSSVEDDINEADKKAKRTPYSLVDELPDNMVNGHTYILTIEEGFAVYRSDKQVYQFEKIEDAIDWAEFKINIESQPFLDYLVSDNEYSSFLGGYLREMYKDAVDNV